MAANSVSRETSRDELKAIFTTKLKTANIVHEVYGGKPAELEGSPAVAISSAGSLRETRLQGVNSLHTWFIFDIWVFVSYEHEAADAEDRLDRIEKVIADIVVDYRFHDGYWDKVEYHSASDASVDVIMQGKAYRREQYKIGVRVIHG